MTQEMTTTGRDLYFEVQADFGMTKHIGGRSATEELIELCRIGTEDLVLEVGCGVGYTSVYLAQVIGCRVVAVDIYERMIERARERAEQAGVADRIEFRLADAQRLPFEANTFDVVFCESVTAFAADKQRAVNEYVRVVRPGGYVGLSESTWLESTPPDLAGYMSDGFQAQPMPADAWRGMLVAAGLRDIEVRVHKTDFRQEAKDQLGRAQGREYGRAIGKMFRRLFTDPQYRKFLSLAARAPRKREAMKYMGYGIYVGRK